MYKVLTFEMVALYYIFASKLKTNGGFRETNRPVSCSLRGYQESNRLKFDT